MKSLLHKAVVMMLFLMSMGTVNLISFHCSGNTIPAIGDDDKFHCCSMCRNGEARYYKGSCYCAVSNKLISVVNQSNQDITLENKIASNGTFRKIATIQPHTTQSINFALSAPRGDIYYKFSLPDEHGKLNESFQLFEIQGTDTITFK